MEEKNFELLRDKLAVVGCKFDLDDIKHWSHDGTFDIPDRTNYGNDLLILNWKIAEDDNGGFQIKKVGAFLEKEIIIPQERINRIDPAQLENLMKKIDWNERDTYNNLLNEESIENDVLLALAELFHSGAKGKEVHDKLAYKYIVNTPGEGIIPNADDLKLAFNRMVRIDLNPEMMITKDEIYNLLNGRFINKSFMEKDQNKNAWFKVDIKNKSESGFSIFEQVPFSEEFHIALALESANIKNWESLLSDDAVMKQIKQGDLVDFVFNHNGLEGKRVFYVIRRIGQ